MFFLKWLIATTISLVLNAGIFAIAKYFMKTDMEPVTVAVLASLLTSVVVIFVFFPATKKKKK
jgi:hypothetical protein